MGAQAATFGWGSIDERYPKEGAVATSKTIALDAWRGERVSAQAIIQTQADLSDVTISASDLKCGRSIIPSSAISTYFVRYVIVNTYADKSVEAIAADRLDESPATELKAGINCPVWMEIKVPADAAPGLYKGTLSANCDGKTIAIPYKLNVSERILPEPSEWSFHLDLWQNPFAVARFFNVPLWSEEHFNVMRPVMERYAAAGGKVITASIIQHPWDCQTFDPFESMIAKMKQIDGSWKYDYAVFDKWVEFMMSCGIKEQIDCYTLVPWTYKFDYYDCATNSVKFIQASPEAPGYREFVLPFLKDFAAHLKAKGWFDITCIAMDERPAEQMKAAYTIVKEADSDYRIEGAANYSVESEGAELMYDMSVGYNFNLVTGKALEARKASGKKLTFYTCCGPEKPNTFTFSDPAESAFLGWHAAALGYDGYLRWAFNSWSPDPDNDTRYEPWSSGDCYLVYPNGSSIRFERLVEGIQDYEKIRILREELSAEELSSLEEILAKNFASNSYDGNQPAAGLLCEGKKILKNFF